MSENKDVAKTNVDPELDDLLNSEFVIFGI